MSSTRVVLAFDFGLKHIGVAIGQLVTRTASPLNAVKAIDGRVTTWSPLDEIVCTWRPDRLLVGLPLNMDGSESEMSERARRFGRQLAGRYHLPVDMVDERLTTFEARELGADRENPHALAARLIAESWLQNVATASPQAGNHSHGRSVTKPSGDS